MWNNCLTGSYRLSFDSENIKEKIILITTFVFVYGTSCIVQHDFWSKVSIESKESQQRYEMIPEKNKLVQQITFENIINSLFVIF